MNILKSWSILHLTCTKSENYFIRLPFFKNCAKIWLTSIFLKKVFHHKEGAFLVLKNQKMCLCLEFLKISKIAFNMCFTDTVFLPLCFCRWRQVDQKLSFITGNKSWGDSSIFDLLNSWDLHHPILSWGINSLKGN